MEFTGGQKVCQRGVFRTKPALETPPKNSDSWPAKWLQTRRKPVITVPLNPSQIGQSLQTSRRARFWRVLPGFRELSKVSGLCCIPNIIADPLVWHVPEALRRAWQIPNRVRERVRPASTPRGTRGGSADRPRERSGTSKQPDPTRASFRRDTQRCRDG